MRIFLLILFLLLIVLAVLYVIGKKSVHHQITIQATPEQVWDALMDTQHYAEWNPVILTPQGELVEGNSVSFTFRQDSDNQYVVKAMVKQVKPGKLLNQAGGIPAVLTYDHRYILEPAGEATKVTIHEEYRGIGVPFWNPAPVQTAYERLNQALKQRAEAL